MDGFPPPSEPIDRLAWVVSVLRAAASVHDGIANRTDECAQWLDDGLRAHLCDGESLDRALGLSVQNGRQPRFYALLRERNRCLRQALNHMDGDVAALLEEIERYGSRVSTAQRERAAPDPLWSPARKALHAAARLNIEMPRTPEGLRKTLELKAKPN